MKPRRTPTSTNVFRLQGGTEDNDLWATVDRQEGTVTSTWELTPDERARVAAGENIRLTIWGGQPPVALAVTSDPLGRTPPSPAP